MKITFFCLSLLFCLALAQKPCCTPSNWQGRFNTYTSDGEIMAGYMSVDTQKNRAYIEGTALSSHIASWYDGIKQVIYSYDYLFHVCAKFKFVALPQICVTNATWERSVTIGSTIEADIWRNNYADGHLRWVLTKDECLPLFMRVTPDFLNHVFLEAEAFFNVKTTGGNFPPLPRACNATMEFSVSSRPDRFPFLL
eukprot:TRINITY_DN11055_c0_g1_i1.p1 TRINITY_DN11055_c0_g1~~TRINITY_DN11055_c0_g1_i1.p1  ORF type:complete len:196 (-),score=31.71 TRINITY_DN11055_c0_g1_i1:137-724(-)